MSKRLISLIVAGIIVIAGWFMQGHQGFENPLKSNHAPEIKTSQSDKALIDMNYDVKKYPENYVKLNDGKVKLTQNDKSLLSQKGQSHFWVDYPKLDKFGRAGEVRALATKQSVDSHASSHMKRPSFKSNVHVSGEYSDGEFDANDQTWRGHQSNNKEINSNGYHGWLYNKSHSLAWSLGGDMETHNITLGTRAQNVGTNKAKEGGGMGYPETQIRNAMKSKPKTKVYYDVKPVYNKDELVPRGSHVRAYSVNDNGKTINMNIWVFNAQDGINIDYYTGRWSKAS